MDSMGIEAMSVGMSQSRLMADVGTAVLAKNLDMVEQMGDNMVEMMNRSMMEQSVQPGLGGNIDLYV